MTPVPEDAVRAAAEAIAETFDEPDERYYEDPAKWVAEARAAVEAAAPFLIEHGRQQGIREAVAAIMDGDYDEAGWLARLLPASPVVSVNGLPAEFVPCGTTASGLPCVLGRKHAGEHRFSMGGPLNTDEEQT